MCIVLNYGVTLIPSVELCYRILLSLTPLLLWAFLRVAVECESEGVEEL